MLPSELFHTFTMEIMDEPITLYYMAMGARVLCGVHKTQQAILKHSKPKS